MVERLFCTQKVIGSTPITSTIHTTHINDVLAMVAKKITVHFVDKNGSVRDIEADLGISLLEVAHQNSIDLEGACEGSLACSTCHVVVDNIWYDKLEKATEDEEDMLDLAFGLTKTSRLGCQIIMKENLDGLKVFLPAGSVNFRV